KALVALGGSPMFELSLRAMAASGAIASVIVVAPPARVEEVRRSFSPQSSDIVAEVVAGGPSRMESTRLGLEALPPGADVVVCHDAARPFASSRLFRSVVDAVSGADGAVPVLPSADTVKRVRDGRILET